MSNPAAEPNPERRDFLKKACCAAIGTAIVLVPAGAGVAVLLDPLKRKVESTGKIFVTSIDSLPENGIPQQFAIIASRVDAWNRLPNAPVGAIYLRRTGENSVEALNVVCPHAGCFVDFRNDHQDFFCPCHNSNFSLDGKILDPKSPSPRGLDQLEVEIRNGKEIWVKFQNFHTGVTEKVPVA